MKKSKYYWELLAAVGGDVAAWHNLGIKEENAGNINRAMKCYMLAATAGCDKSLQLIREGFLKGHVTRDDLENTLRT